MEADLALRRGDIAVADSLFRQVLRWSEVGGSLHARFDARYGIAAAATARDQFAEAAAQLDSLRNLARQQQVRAGTVASRSRMGGPPPERARAG